MPILPSEVKSGWCGDAPTGMRVTISLVPRVEYRDRVHARLGEEDLFSVRTDVQGPRDIVERDQSPRDASGDVEYRRCLMALLLAGGIGRPPVGRDTEVVRLCHGRPPDDPIGAGVDRL